MTDRELLELAAKAAGVEHDPELTDIHGCVIEDNTEGAYQQYYWNPLTDDGDALRLAVRLHLTVDLDATTRNVAVWYLKNPLAGENYNDDPYAATRRAIVRAAAEIGRSMK